ncbi:uncharacterized protein GJ701_007938 isoform 1-T1 [Geothlypis trichas]
MALLPHEGTAPPRLLPALPGRVPASALLQWTVLSRHWANRSDSAVCRNVAHSECPEVLEDELSLFICVGPSGMTSILISFVISTQNSWEVDTNRQLPLLSYDQKRASAFSFEGKKPQDQVFIKLSWINETGNLKMMSNHRRSADLDWSTK